MENGFSVSVLRQNPVIDDILVPDLKALGFVPSLDGYPDIDSAVVTENPPDIILLDLTVCDYNALSVSGFLQRDGVLPPETSLVALVSVNSTGQVPVEFDFADYIVFPYEITELGFRLRRVIHLRDRRLYDDVMNIGELSVSLSRYEVKVKGEPVVFSHKEYGLFKYLVTHPGIVFTREELFDTVWGNSHLGESRTVDVHIRRIRMKIGDIDQRYIKTVRGVGYSFRYDNN